MAELLIANRANESLKNGAYLTPMELSYLRSEDVKAFFVNRMTNPSQ